MSVSKSSCKISKAKVSVECSVLVGLGLVSSSERQSRCERDGLHKLMLKGSHWRRWILYSNRKALFNSFGKVK